MLYGDENLSDEINVLAYLSIQYFMKETKLSIDWDEGLGQHRFLSVVIYILFTNYHDHCTYTALLEKTNVRGVPLIATVIEQFPIMLC